MQPNDKGKKNKHWAYYKTFNELELDPEWAAKYFDMLRSIDEHHIEVNPPVTELQKEVAKLLKLVKSKRKMEKVKVVIFYGFTGKMKYQYSVVDADKKELQSRMATIQNMIDIPWSLHDMDKWEDIMRDSGASQPFVETKFEDAMSIVRAGEYAEKKEELVPFEEPEEDEFTDDCTVDCSPGDHKCRKK